MIRERIIIERDCDPCLDEFGLNSPADTVTVVVHTSEGLVAKSCELCENHIDNDKLYHYLRTYGQPVRDFVFKLHGQGVNGRAVEASIPAQARPVAPAKEPLKAEIEPVKPRPFVHNPVLRPEHAARITTQQPAGQVRPVRKRNRAEDIRIRCKHPGCKTETSQQQRTVHAKVHNRKTWEIEWEFVDPSLPLVGCECGLKFVEHPGMDVVAIHVRQAKCPATELHNIR